MKYNRKKSLGILLGLSLLGLSACGSSDSNTTTNTTNSTETPSSTAEKESSGEKTQLTLWHYYNSNTKDTLDRLILEFNTTVGEEKGITVEAFSHSSVNDLAEALVNSANKEVGVADFPSIFSAYADTALLLDNMGMVASMDDYFTQEELDSFQQDFLNEGRFDQESSLKIFPVAKSTELVFVNDTDFQVFADDVGTSLEECETWEGLATVAEQYYHWTDDQTPDVEGDGKALFGVDSEANFLLVGAKQLGDEMYDYDGETVTFGLSESTARKMWDTLLVPYMKGYYASLGSYRSDDVKSGDLLMYSGSNSSVYYFPNMVERGRAEAYEISGTSFPYPYFQGESKLAVQQGAGMVVASSDSATEAAAAEFLKWFTEAENNTEFAVSTGYIPVQIKALNLEDVLAVSPEDMPEIVESTLDVTYETVMPSYEFYATKAFDGSYDTRNIIRDTMREAISYAVDHPELDTWGEEAFQSWYQALSQSITEVLEG